MIYGIVCNTGESTNIWLSTSSIAKVLEGRKDNSISQTWIGPSGRKYIWYKESELLWCRKPCGDKRIYSTKDLEE